MSSTALSVSVTRSEAASFSVIETLSTDNVSTYNSSSCRLCWGLQRLSYPQLSGLCRRGNHGSPEGLALP